MLKIEYLEQKLSFRVAYGDSIQTPSTTLKLPYIIKLHETGVTTHSNYIAALGRLKFGELFKPFLKMLLKTILPIND